MSASLRTRGADRTARQLRRIAERSANPIGLWPHVGTFLAGAHRRQFVTEGAYGGRPWSLLDPYYVRWKAQHGYSRKILVQNGALRASYTSRPMSVERYSRFSAVFGSDHYLAPFHHWGTRVNGRRAIPARRVLLPARRIRGPLGKMAAEYITTGRTSGARFV